MLAGSSKRKNCLNHKVDKRVGGACAKLEREPKMWCCPSENDMENQMCIKSRACIFAQYARVSRCFRFITALPLIKRTRQRVHRGQSHHDKWNQRDPQRADIMTELHHILIIQGQKRITNKEGQSVYEYTLTGYLINWKRIHFTKGDSKWASAWQVALLISTDLLGHMTPRWAAF